MAWVLLAALGAALLLTNLMRRAPEASAPTSASFPAEAGGLPVLTVRAAMDVRAADDRRDIAVAGWFQQPFPMSCPAPAPPSEPFLEGNCSVHFTWLMADPETIVRVRADGAEGSRPVGPAINPIFDGPDTDWARPLPPSGDAIPTPVVLIGHFDDPRAAGCQPEARRACRDLLVVTAVPWADGVLDP